ncbi:MAG: hypothetical protein PHW13_08985 [Methylococcales bacterium]|nr:hypothetical protein [Methylococcales bacterium]
MKSRKTWKSILLVTAIAFAGTAHAVKPGEEEEKECKKPKFREFVPAHKAEVPPESAISFHISRGAEPASVTAEAKGEHLHVAVTDKISFLVATAKLPPTLREGFARIHITAKAADGGCMGQDGWLIKIGEAGGNDKPAENQQAK